MNIQMYCITARLEKRRELQDYMANHQKSDLSAIISDLTNMIEEGSIGDEFTIIVGSTSISIKKEAEPTDPEEPDYDIQAEQQAEAWLAS
jgi:hypothetical protein